ncbi:MAG: nucleoside phosphorylase [Bacteroidales bacterium]|nr:nucleoside phosphorylase [Bacteroidales bacterium]
MKIKASELPLQAGGQIYHLNLHPEEIATKIILVGDPGRVEDVSKHFDRIDVKRQNRELVTHTGTFNHTPVTVLSTGMGTDNIDIVLNELDALCNIDLKSMEIKEKHTSLTLVRVGTCGILQPEIPLHAVIAAEYGLGMDGLLHFYKHENLSDENMVKAFVQHARWNECLPYPYCVPASRSLLDHIAVDMYKGITATAPGFFGPQGRETRAPLHYPHLNNSIESFEYHGHKILNLEMETSAIYGLGALLKHQVLTCCLGIANRVTKEFSSNYHAAMDNLIDMVLDRLTRIDESRE